MQWLKEAFKHDLDSNRDALREVFEGARGLVNQHASILARACCAQALGNCIQIERTFCFCVLLNPANRSDCSDHHAVFDRRIAEP